jgi:hypothetical protein
LSRFAAEADDVGGIFGDGACERKKDDVRRYCRRSHPQSFIVTQLHQLRGVALFAGTGC